MALLDLFTARRTRPWRLLREGVRVLGRIADALEEQNALMRAANPDAAARMRGPEPAVESGVSYVNPEDVFKAEQQRLQIHRETGRWLNDEQLVDYLQSLSMLAATRDQELS